MKLKTYQEWLDLVCGHFVRCFTRQPPVQVDPFWVVSRVVILYSFDSIIIRNDMAKFLLLFLLLNTKFLLLYFYFSFYFSKFYFWHIWYAITLFSIWSSWNIEVSYRKAVSLYFQNQKAELKNLVSVPDALWK